MSKIINVKLIIFLVIAIAHSCCTPVASYPEIKKIVRFTTPTEA